MAMIRAAVLLLAALPAHATIVVVGVVDGGLIGRSRCYVPPGAPRMHVPEVRRVAPTPPARRGPELICVEWEDNRCVRRSIQMEWRAK
jgi:hypothetical protein